MLLRDPLASVDCKRGQRKGATSKNVQKCHIKTASKSVKNIFRHFLTIFAQGTFRQFSRGTRLPAPLGGGGELWLMCTVFWSASPTLGLAIEAFMFRDTLVVRTKDGCKSQRPFEMLEPIPKSKYPSITEEEEALPQCHACFSRPW